jgi:hypothetical protein
MDPDSVNDQIFVCVSKLSLVSKFTIESGSSTTILVIGTVVMNYFMALCVLEHPLVAFALSQSNPADTIPQQNGFSGVTPATELI